MKLEPFRLPRLYAIVDAGSFAGEKDSDRSLTGFASELVRGGIRLLQYRNKSHASGGLEDPQQMLSQARELRRTLSHDVQLIMNDRADLCIAAGFDGVHLGQDDLSVEGARQILGPGKIIGYSTHTLEQVKSANDSSADYLALGPIFSTRSKLKADPVVGLDLLGRARRLTRKPLVAIGGITRKNCASVIQAGADAVAVISDLLDSPRKTAEEFLRILE
jgi:thiamine-phosphate pyrophosphorylase